MQIRRLVVGVLFAVLAVGTASALVLRHAGGGDARASACPPGFTSERQRALARDREQFVERAREAATAGGERDRAEAGRGADGDAEGAARGCQPLKHPESFADVARISANQTARAAAPATRVRPGAYANAVAQARSAAAQPRSVPGAGGTWTPAGTTPLLDDVDGYDSVNGQGLADLAGRITGYAADPADAQTVYAAVGEGGVWKSTDAGQSWRSVGETLPTQAVGSVAVVDTGSGERLLALTGDDVFGGGTTYSGLGVWSSDDDGATWRHSTGVPDAALGFRLKVDPADPANVYAATGKGLYRSTDSGLSFNRVTLHTGCEDLADPKCFLANMVTDVAIKVPDKTGTTTPSTSPVKVVAAVGWRAGDKPSVDADHHPEAPGNGIYTSDDGTTFTRVPGDAATGFGLGQPGETGDFQSKIGRIEMGVASGDDQNHDYLYAVVQDPSGFKNGQVGSIDVPDESPKKAVTTTYLRGIYVSPDFGQTWRLMSNATGLQSPTTGSALSITACAASLYCPGVQAWYNQWIEPDPGSGAGPTGAPKRLTFGLEEVWENEQPSATGADGPTSFKVVGRYFGGTTCQFLNSGLPACPTNRPPQSSTTTHPDQHSAIYLPVGGKSRLLVGNDGGSYHQDVGPADDIDNTQWGRGFQNGFNTLIAYGANVARDGTIYAGLQDNGEMRINPDGRQIGIYGGDGGISAVDPDHSDTAYEEYTNGDMRATTDGGKTWNDITPPTDTYQFTNPFTMDPADANHLITAGTKVYETTRGTGTTTSDWKQVFDLGTAPGGAANQMSAIDVRGVAIPGTQGLPTGPHTANFTYSAGGTTVPGPGSSEGVYVPGTYDDHPFTIGKDDGDAAVNVEVTWADANNDWDLEVFRKEADGSLTQVGQSANGGTTKERVSVPNPPPGDYVVRVENFAATGTFDSAVTFDQRTSDAPKTQNAAYVAYCGYCDVLNTRPFSNGIATNVLGDKPGQAGSPDGWHKVAASGLPRRYITSIKADPADPTTVYATVAGYSRRWLPVGALGEGIDPADVGKGHVFKSTDGGQSFTDISGNLPDAPAEWSVVRQDQLIVGTDVGVFVSDVNGGTWELLGRGLPNAPTYSLDLQQKGAANKDDVVVAATQGRGVWKLPLPAVAATTRTTPQALFGPAARYPALPGSGLKPERRRAPSCARDDGIRAVSARSHGRGVLLAFSRRKALPVGVDVFQASRGTTILDNRRVALFGGRQRSFTWNGRANRRGKRVADGIYFVRFTMRVKGRSDTRRLAIERRHGRWRVLPAFDTHAQCAVIADAKAERPVYGGKRRRALLTSFRVGPNPAVVSVAVMRGSRTVRRIGPRAVAAGRLYRLSFSAKTLGRGIYRFVVVGDAGGHKVTRTVTARRL
ncbi:MAG: hypothetical protein ACXVFK_08220 [Solirubrobacteraceae bacterium]